ncbi:MAG: amino acid ABC transporter permease [Coriobacteriales bacterium]
MDFGLMMGMLGEGFVVTLEIFFLTLLGSLPLGLLIMFLRRNKLGFNVGKTRIRPISLITQFYISVMRGTPLMLQLFVVYFAPYFIFGQPLSDGWRFSATIVAFILNYAAYFAEIYRSGYESIPRGQFEAADVLGYSRWQAFRKIILPQVIKRILPPMTNEIITLVKDTSLAFAIGCAEMFTVAKSIVASTRLMWAFVAAAALYYVFNLLLTFILNRAEKKLAYYHD